MPLNNNGTQWTSPSTGKSYDLKNLSEDDLQKLPMSAGDRDQLMADYKQLAVTGEANKGNFDPAGMMGFRPNVIDQSAPGAKLDASGGDAARAQLNPMLLQLQQQATTGDGAWRQAFSQAIERTKANAQAVGQSDPSSGYQSSLRNIANAKGAVAQRGVGEEETLRNESMLDARRTLGDVLGKQAQGDIGQSAEAARVERARRIANQSMIDQSLENRKSTEKSIEGAFSDGGPVPGRAPVFGDDEQNDTVPAKLSPGEIVIPRSITQGTDAPARAAAFVRAIQAGGGKGAGRNFADGGSAGIRPVTDEEGGGGGVVAANILVPHIGRQIEYNNLRKNVGGGGGGTLDTSQYDETARSQGQLAQLFSGEAQGYGPTITGPMMQRQQDAAVEQATAPGGGSSQHRLQAIAASGATGAGDVGAQKAREQSGGQQAFAKALQQRRAQEMQLASAKQQAAWEKTLADAGVSVANQQALRGTIAAAGQGAAAFAGSGKGEGYHADPNNLTSLSNNPYPEGNPSGGGMDPSELDTPEFKAEGGAVGDERAVTKRLVAAIEQGRKAKPPREREAKKMSAEEAAAFAADMENQYLPQQFVIADRDVMAANAKKMAARGGWRDNFFPRQELQDPYLETEVSKSKPTTVKPLEERPLSTPSIEVKPWKPIYPRAPDGEVMKPYADIEYGSGDGRGPALKEALAETRRMMAGDGQKMAHGGAADDEAVAPPLFMPEAGGPTFSYQPADPLGLPGRRDAGARTYTGADLGLGGGFSDSATVSLPAPSSAPPLGAASPSQQLEARRLHMPVATGSAMAPARQETLVQVGETPDGMPIVEKRMGEMVPDLKSLKPKADWQPTPAASIGKAGAPTGAASTPNFGAKADQAARGAAQAQYDADKANADAQAHAAGAQADALESQVLERKATAERVQQRISAAQTRFDAAQQQAANIDTTVDPGRFWASRSTGDRVMGIMGLVLGALGAGPDGVNRAAVMLNQAVDRDIDAQKSEHELRLKKGAAGVDAARSYYAMARDAGQDELAATDLAHAAALRGVVARGQQLVAQTSDPQAKARLLGFFAGIDQGAAQRSTTGWEKAQDRALEREKIDATREKGAHPSQAAATVVAEANERVANIQRNAARLTQLIDEHGTQEKLTPGVEAEMNQLRSALIVDSAKLKDPNGVVREPDEEREGRSLGFEPGFWQRSSNAKAAIKSFAEAAGQRRVETLKSRGVQP